MKLQKYISSETTEDFEIMMARKFAVKIGNEFIAKGGFLTTTNLDKVRLYDSYGEALEVATTKKEKTEIYSTI